MAEGMISRSATRYGRPRPMVARCCRVCLSRGVIGHFRSSSRNRSDDTSNNGGAVWGQPTERLGVMLGRLISRWSFTEECACEVAGAMAPFAPGWDRGLCIRPSTAGLAARFALGVGVGGLGTNVGV